MFWRRKKITYTPPCFEEIKKRAKILVIDDNDFAYAPLFSRDGYTIEKWDDIESLEKLENNYFDLILLDIQGVGQNESEEEGFGILKHIRAKSPAQIVIAFSNADWSLKYQGFFDLADRKLAKSQDYVEFKRTVDDLLIKRFNHNFYIEKIEKIQNLSPSEKTKIIQAAQSSMLSGKIEEVSAATRGISKEDAQLVLTVVQTAIAVCSI
ncbi:response regulator [Stutzerimonas stutzeri]|uniref:response regulator n=1 Tax=Stutzerimonas stutzeri TaxID=316 RepID=UPI0005EAF27D|nr:response regulator [Stutzerimonas stutzeri]